MRPIEPDFFIGGVDVEKSLPRGGSLQLGWATSQGEVLGSGNLAETSDLRHDGTAYQVTLSQPLPFLERPFELAIRVRPSVSSIHSAARSLPAHVAAKCPSK